MKMNKFIIPVFLLLVTDCFAQKTPSASGQSGSRYNEAKTYAQAGDQDKAINLLQKVIKSDPEFYMAYFGLADIYHETGQKELEKQALLDGLGFSGDKFPPAFKFLAELLYGEAAYAEALKNMERFCSLKNPLSTAEHRLLESCRFSVKAIEAPVLFKAENGGPAINSAEDEYWPGLDGEACTLVFTRLIAHDKDGAKLGYPQEDFYVSRKDSSGWQKAIPMGPPINTAENEGAQCISADGRLLFFTGCGRADGLGSCDIYMSVKQKGVWSDPVNLGAPVNSGSWESQPSVSADGNWLFFASNRNGGKGKMDIWRAEKLGISPEGFPVYGKVSNLEGVNTTGNEQSPFIHADGRTLYFASDFWPGLGGNDLFFVRLDSLGTAKPHNLGYPVNTSGNEEGMVVEVSGERAWYTVNNKGYGGRDIYWFLMPDNCKPAPVSWVKGRVINRKSGKLVAPDIVLNDLITDRLVQHMYPFENEGEFLFCLPKGHNYRLNISNEGYLFHSENFNLTQLFNREKPMNLTIGLDPIESGKSTVLRNVFFDTDSYHLKPESTGELAEIVDFMTKNPGLIIEIGGHTDNLGSEKYNLTLSGNRAISVVNYLVDKGISPTRLTGKGYGFSVPLSDNLTEEGRAQNRRTEFRILDNKPGK